MYLYVSKYLALDGLIVIRDICERFKLASPDVLQTAVAEVVFVLRLVT